VISRDWALGHATALRTAHRLDEIAQHDFIVVAPETTIFDLLAGLQQARASVAVVASPAGSASSVPAPGPDIRGVVTRADITGALAESMELFED
jgi:CBS domain-containing protein